MNANACNYESLATFDDGSCLIVGESCDDNNSNINPDQSEITYNVEIRDLQGKVLETLDLGTLQPGVHNRTVDVTSWAAGSYSYTLVIDGVRATRKLMVK